MILKYSLQPPPLQSEYFHYPKIAYVSLCKQFLISTTAHINPIWFVSIVLLYLDCHINVIVYCIVFCVLFLLLGFWDSFMLLYVQWSLAYGEDYGPDTPVVSENQWNDVFISFFFFLTYLFQYICIYMSSVSPFHTLINLSHSLKKYSNILNHFLNS